LGFLVDYAVYSLLLLFTDVLWVANVLARIVSATVNFTVNRRFVFESKESVWTSAVKYFLLAAVILAGNTVVLNFLVNAGLHKLWAKLMTEVFFFIFSWLIQRLLVFRKRKGDN
jgi:putative flippase GtrA